jgi:hypothetical protein
MRASCVRSISLAKDAAASRFSTSGPHPENDPWLFAVPVFRRGTRHYAFNWAQWDGSNYKIEDVCVDYRNYLCIKAQLEFEMHLCTTRLRSSEPHEQGAIRHRADCVGSKYQAHISMEPFVKCENEMRMIVALIRSSPLSSHESFAQQLDACRAICYQLRIDRFELRDVLHLERHKHYGHIAFRESVAQHCIERHESNLRSEVDLRGAARRNHLKTAYYAEARQAASKLTGASLNSIFDKVSSSQYRWAREHSTLRRKRLAYKDFAFDSQPIQWYWAGFHYAFHRTYKVNRTLYDIAYRDTKFGYATKFTQRQCRLRFAAWVRFRDILDDLVYETLRIFTTNKQHVCELVDELMDLRRYRIAKYPQSISEQNIAKSRSLIM